MRVNRVADPAEFLLQAGPLLLADEARHNLLLGIAGTLRDHPSVYPEFHLWLVEDGGRTVGAALQTLPLNLVLARPAEASVAEPLAEALRDGAIELPGVTGATPEVDDFADAWERNAGARRRRRMAQRIYRLTTLPPARDVPGRARTAIEADRALLVSWVREFADEAIGDSPGRAFSAEQTVDARLRDGAGGFMLWEDGEPVSLAGWGGKTPNGIRIGPVYTPPSLRRRGYGSAVTAAVSADQLAAGRQFCFLYTDLANPTSNRIYTEIGYEPVCDSIDYAFDVS